MSHVSVLSGMWHAACAVSGIKSKYEIVLNSPEPRGGRGLDLEQRGDVGASPPRKKNRLAFEMAFELQLPCDAWPGRTARRAESRPR
jgi:hypothetical protein